MPLREDIIERANARLGTVLKGKWRLDAVIGIGGMASVYAATHRNQARVAIKLLHAEVALDAEVTARFLREGYVANAVGHPGTVTVLDDDVSEDKAPFLVMELLIGQTLDTMLAMEPDGLSAREVLPLLDQLLEVLTAAHEKGIVHRDLKPENLFLTSEGRLKVLDFGIARLRELSVQSATATQAGSVLGTPAFMAPEQALGRWNEVDGRTDIWAVGATAFTLLSGQHVHEAQTLQEQLVLSATRPARSVREVAPNVPEELARVVDQALGFSRVERFADARAMRGALRGAAASLLGEPFSPISPRIPDAARVSTHDDLHGATLVAPVEVTSAITGRAETGTTTGQPVTRSTVVSGRPPRGQAPLLVLLVGLGLVGLAVLLFAARRQANADRSVLPTALLTASAAAQAPTASAVGAPPAVAPVLDSATTAAVVSSPPPAIGARKPAALAAAHPAPHPAATLEKPPVKSLLGGDNPFDRRH
jgi:eukaryotic-like serine/threonine-protein kinase